MNKIFENQKMIKLNDNYRLIPDGGNGVSLIFSESRKRDKTEKKDGKIVKTGEQEDYIFEEPRYFLSVHQALYKFFELTQAEGDDLKEILEKTTESLRVIKNFETKFENW